MPSLWRGGDRNRDPEAGVDIHSYLKAQAYARTEVDQWLAQKAFPFSRYDSGLGYLHRERCWNDGVDDSTTFYH